MWCDHDNSNYSYYVLDAHCVNLEVLMNDMSDKMIETVKENMFSCFNQLKGDDNVLGPNFSLEPPRHEG